jgi:hypothetical protein
VTDPSTKERKPAKRVPSLTRALNQARAGCHTIDPTAISQDTKLRLAKAAELAFPDGSISASALRAEARRGHLQIWTIANKQFTTLRAIEEMTEKCRDKQKESGSTLPPRAGETASCISGSPGSSEMERIKSAQASLRLTAQKLSGSARAPNRNSPNMSGANTKCPASADVIRLKSSSSTS